MSSAEEELYQEVREAFFKAVAPAQRAYDKSRKEAADVRVYLRDTAQAAAIYKRAIKDIRGAVSKEDA